MTGSALVLPFHRIVVFYQFRPAGSCNPGLDVSSRPVSAVGLQNRQCFMELMGEMQAARGTAPVCFVPLRHRGEVVAASLCSIARDDCSETRADFLHRDHPTPRRYPREMHHLNPHIGGGGSGGSGSGSRSDKGSHTADSYLSLCRSNCSADRLNVRSSSEMAAASAAARGSRAPRFLSTLTRCSFNQIVFLMKRES